MLTRIGVGGRWNLQPRELVCEQPGGRFARVLEGRCLRDGGALIGTRRRQNQSRIEQN
jgi:hypothetical protein